MRSLKLFWRKKKKPCDHSLARPVGTGETINGAQFSDGPKVQVSPNDGSVDAALCYCEACGQVLVLMKSTRDVQATMTSVKIRVPNV